MAASPPGNEPVILGVSLCPGWEHGAEVETVIEHLEAALGVVFSFNIQLARPNSFGSTAPWRSFRRIGLTMCYRLKSCISVYSLPNCPPPLSMRRGFSVSQHTVPSEIGNVKGNGVGAEWESGVTHERMEEKKR